jgi:signal transduction histidine kinase
MNDNLKFDLKRRFGPSSSLVARLANLASRHNATLLLLLVSCAVATVGVFVIRDLQTANRGAQDMYTGSVHGLQRIGELQYDTQETRRATFYALTTSDSNLQLEYADQSRNADQRVKEGIAEYQQQAKRPPEIALGNRLALDWTQYLNIRDEVLASILEGSTKEAVGLDLSGGVPAFERVRRDLTEVKQLYDEDASVRRTNLVASSHRSTIRLIAILGITFLTSCSAVWAIQKSKIMSAIELARLQMEFVASVSHELRTPLAVLSSAADNIADGLVEGKVSLRKYGSVLQNQSRRMGALIDEILLFASTEDRNQRYVLRPIQLSEVIDSVVSSTEGLIQDGHFTIDRHIESNLPLVMGDSVGISQCLHNLLGNALKYGGEEKWIALKAFLSPSEHGSGQEIRVSVTDRGIGIEASEIGHIFEPFYRSPRVTARQIHGTGLGLSLAQRIAGAMGGRISVVSGFNAGTTFTLHLQIAKGDDPHSAPAASQRASSSHS